MHLSNSILPNTQFVLQKIPHLLRLKLMNKKIINPSIQIEIDKGRYVVKTANSHEEISQVLSLRFEVFYQEFSNHKYSSPLPYDIDFYDFGCDHLIVKDKEADKVIACYRLRSDNSNKKLKRFYTEGEFQINDFLNSLGNKLELGRACVHKDHRRGTVISLLWSGILEYAQKSGSRFMFGCSSVSRNDFEQIPNMLSWLEENDAFINHLTINVHSKYTLPKELSYLKKTNFTQRSSQKALNSLMHMYVLAGAKLSREMAYDAEMDCIDFFTLIDLDTIPNAFKKKFAA
jgi:putative hemolysin